MPTPIDAIVYNFPFVYLLDIFFFFSSRRRHTRLQGDWSSDVCSSDLFKGGIGTASRRLDPPDGGYTVGVLVQCNYGRRRPLRIAGVPVGREISDLVPCRAPCAGPRSGLTAAVPPEVGSIIIVVATDAPLLSHQLQRIARRAALGVGRLGGVASNSSGDI